MNCHQPQTRHSLMKWRVQFSGVRLRFIASRRTKPCLVCENLMKMFHDKLHRVRQSLTNCVWQNTRLLRQVLHRRKWLFLKSYQNYLTDNISAADSALSALSAIYPASLKCPITVEYAVASGPKITTSYL
jgi:hypothetical protein